MTKALLRPRWRIEMDGAVARITFVPYEGDQANLLEWYGRPGDGGTEPVTLVLNGDDLSDLVAVLTEARAAADAAALEWTKGGS